MVITLARQRQLAFDNEDDDGWSWKIVIHIFPWNPLEHGVIYLQGLVVEGQTLNGLVIERQNMNGKVTETQALNGLIIERQNLKGLVSERQDINGKIGTG